MKPLSLSLRLPLPSVVKRFVVNREVRLLLIHLLIWVTVSLVQYYLMIRFVPAGKAPAGTAVIYQYASQPFVYLQITLLINLIFVVCVHGCYWFYRWVFDRDRRWSAPVFFGFAVALFIGFAFLMGIYAGIFERHIDQAMVVSSVSFSWVYALVFTFVRAYRQQKRDQQRLIQQKTQAELAALKAQVNPHFLFNTLNNLYGTALTGDSDRTAVGIEHLSGVMRHMVEESKRDRTPIGKEIKFLEDTIELHQMRIPRLDTIRIQSIMRWDGLQAEIAPLLLVSFIENAFKYGISMSQPCFVDIRLTVEQGQLSFRCRNSIIPTNRLGASTGTGIDNVQQRLALLYPKRHTLTIQEENDVFDVALTIVLQNS
ncbi:sensor histidine kinase [Spirosoma sp. 209]|uniref:sensor histidine kinase n=1 Tax=Spirosoma sp. 209 TaxID=1955701 RepID=UPI00098CFB9C|nr:histidine kinase [Spirosoma sp. 209]